MNTSARAERSIFLADERATLDLGQRLAEVVAPGLYLALSGELGSGKTTLVRGLLRGLGYAGKVKSPTYTLVEFYNLSKLDLYHFDLYRFNDPQEWFDAGFRDYFQPHNLCVVEWPERAQDLLPTADLQVALNEESGGRRACVLAKTEVGIRCLERLPA